jgi:iron complex outermembrane recepter protein
MECSLKRPVRVGILTMLAAFCACLLAFRVQATEDDRRVQLQIEAGTAAVRLNEWAKKTHFNVLTSFDQTSKLRTKEVNGLYEPIEALRLMLEGTGLEFMFVNARFVSIYRPEGAQVPVRTTVPPPGKSRKKIAGLPVNEGLTHLDEVKITGTNIHDTVQVAMPQTQLTQVDFDAIGAFSVVDAIRTMPHVFGGGPTEDTELGIEAGTNSGRGRGVNLRALDAGSTLSLINGRRLAPGGSEGLFIDITSIPLIAIKQIDIVSDSASALYGADAVGGVVNFVMRENIEGAETQLRAGGLGEAPGNVQFGQLFGNQWDGGSGLMAFEYYERDALAASDRNQVTSDLRRFGGDDFRSLNSNPGTIVLGQLTFAIPEGQDGTGLTLADLVPNTENRHDKWAEADILPEQERWSAYGNLRHALTDNVDVFADALFTDRRAIGRSASITPQLLPVPCSNAFMITGLCPPAPPPGPPLLIPVAYSFTDDLGPIIGDVDVVTGNIAAGFNRTIGMDWGLTTTVGYALEQQHLVLHNTLDVPALMAALASPDPARAFNPFGDGSHTSREVLDDIRSQQDLRTHSTVTSLNVTASGPVFPLPGGDAKLAIGTDLRAQAFESNVRVGDGPLNRVHNDRDTHALFGELYLPLVGERNARPGLYSLELSLAARLESYSDFGEATTPRVGLAWSPSPGFSLRGSWAKSLRAPSLYDLNEVNNVVTQLPILTPGTPPGLVPVLVQSGRNSQLQEERAKSWTFGADFTPEGISGLSLAVTYFNVEFRDRISDLDFADYNWLSDPLVASRVTFNPTPEQMSAACSSGQFSSALGSGISCGSIPVAAIIDVRKNNGWFLRTSGVDFSARYALGDFRFGLLGTYVLDYSEALLKDSPLVQMKGTQNFPAELRMRGSTTWERGRLAATGAVNFTDSYRDTINERRVGSWTTLDFGLAYTLGQEGAETRFALNVENAFDEMPPFLNNLIGLGYDAENGDIGGRIISFQLRRNW